MFLLDTHNISLAMQAESRGESISDMKAWEKIKMKKPDLSKPQPSLPEYYGTAKKNLDLYCKTFQGFHPEVDDPIQHETDVRALVVAGRGSEHGRYRLADTVTPHIPELSFARGKATLTVDDPAIPPPRRPSRARYDVSCLNFILFSTFVPDVTKFTRFIFLEIVACFRGGLRSRFCGI